MSGYPCQRDGCRLILKDEKSLQQHIDVRHGPEAPEEPASEDMAVECPVALETPTQAIWEEIRKLQDRVAELERRLKFFVSDEGEPPRLWQLGYGIKPAIHELPGSEDFWKVSLDGDSFYPAPATLTGMTDAEAIAKIIGDIDVLDQAASRSEPSTLSVEEAAEWLYNRLGKNEL